MDTSNTNIRTLIVDDHPIVRYGLRHILDAEDGIEVVGDLGSVLGIEKVLSQFQPDVVILDLEFDDAHGVEALRQFREVAPDMHVIIYTSHDDENLIVQVVELGVNGYLLKGSSNKEIADAIRSVHDGGTALEVSVATKLLYHINKRSNRKKTIVNLSGREIQVLELLATGKSNRDIGTALFISESTVKFHVHGILGKLDAENRTQAVSIAAEQGIIGFKKNDG